MAEIKKDFIKFIVILCTNGVHTTKLLAMKHTRLKGTLSPNFPIQESYFLTQHTGVFLGKLKNNTIILLSHSEPDYHGKNDNFLTFKLIKGYF